MKHKRKILIVMVMCVVIFATVTLATLSLKRAILRKIGLIVVQKARAMAFPVDVIPNIPYLATAREASPKATSQKNTEKSF